MSAAQKKKPLTLAEVKSIVFERWSRNMAELSIDQKRLLHYLSKFTRVEDPIRAREAVNQLTEKFGLSEEHAIMLVNVIPSSVEELKAYLYKDYPLLTQENYKEMLSILKSLVEEGE